MSGAVNSTGAPLPASPAPRNLEACLDDVKCDELSGGGTEAWPVQPLRNVSSVLPQRPVYGLFQIMC